MLSFIITLLIVAKFIHVAKFQLDFFTDKIGFKALSLNIFFVIFCYNVMIEGIKLLG